MINFSHLQSKIDCFTSWPGDVLKRLTPSPVNVPILEVGMGWVWVLRLFLLPIREDYFAVLSATVWEELPERLIPSYALVNVFKIFFLGSLGPGCFK